MLVSFKGKTSICFSKFQRKNISKALFSCSNGNLFQDSSSYLVFKLQTRTNSSVHCWRDCVLFLKAVALLTLLLLYSFKSAKFDTPNLDSQVWEWEASIFKVFKAKTAKHYVVSCNER